MTVSVQTPISSYTGNGVTTAFSFGYYVGASGDLVVMVDGVVQTLTTHYSLTGIGSGSGGTCTFVTAPASGASVVLYRDTDLLRDTDYQDNGDLLAAILDADFDRIWLALQEVVTGAKTSPRNVRAPVGESLNELPEASARAGKVLSFNASTGQPEAVAPTTGTATDLAIQLAGVAAGDGADLIGFRPTMTAADDTLAGAMMDGAVNLEWWSHLVTGNDYTTALAAAVATGKNVYVPYRLATRTVSAGVSFANNNQTVFGDNPDSARIQFTGSTGVTFNADGKTGCRVVGLWLEGPGVASSISSTYTQCGFRAITATRCDAIGCVFSGWAGGGVFIQDATDCRVLNCSFTDAKTMPLVTDAFGTADITLWGSCVDCMVDGNRSNSGAAYGVVLQTINSTTQTARRNSITRNVISGAKNYSILVYNYSSGTPPVVNNIYDTLIQGNTVETVYGFYNNPATGNKDYGAGIYVLSAEGTRVIGNTVKDVCKDTNGSALTPAGIAINATSKAVVSANYIDTSAWYGVFVVDGLQLGSGSNQGASTYIPDGFVVVEANTIKATTRHGIFIQNKHKVRVSGNTVDTVSGASQSGIVTESTLTGTTYPTLKWISVSGNTVYNVVSSSIQIANATGAVVAANTIEIATTGIYLDSVDAVVSGNMIRNVTTGSGRGIDMRSTGTNSAVSGNRISACTVGILAGHRGTFDDTNDLTGCTTKWSGTYAGWQASVPAAGTWVLNDRVRQSVATVGQPKAWVCTVAGTPGTWVSEGNL